MQALEKHIVNSNKISNLLLSNIILKDLSKRSIWIDEFFADYEVESISIELFNYVTTNFDTITINGFVTDLNLETIINSIGYSTILSTDVSDLRNAISMLEYAKRIFSLSDVFENIRGYCIVNTFAISKTEAEIEVQDFTKVLQDLSKMRNEIFDNKQTISDLKKDLDSHKSLLHEKEEILAGRASLSWS